MLIVKGTGCSVLLADGRKMKLPGAMLHDETGRDWPKLSALFMPIRKTSEEVDGIGRDYFGSSYVARAATISKPPSATSAWDEVGEVTDIWYDRSGSSHPHFYHHRFVRKRLFRTYGSVKLLRRGGIYRLQLPPGSKWTWRGFVRP